MTIDGVAYDADLLPAPGSSERCASHSERIALDPGGSALSVDELIVVDVALPWPKPVWAIAGFTAVPEQMMEASYAGRRVRVLAAVPLDDCVHRVVTHSAGESGLMERREHQVSEDRVTEVLESLLRSGIDASPSTVVDTASPARELLLCTQGSHDVCCGSRGAALFGAMAESHPDLLVRRVSHTGGHRMAPTGLTLPDGRMWAMIDPAEMGQVIDRTGSAARLAARCRGWIGAGQGPAQMAERAVFAEVDDWSFDAEARTTTIVGESGDAHEVRVDTNRGTWMATVEPGRAVPTIACGEPGGLPAKPGQEWVVSGLVKLPL